MYPICLFSAAASHRIPSMPSHQSGRRNLKEYAPSPPDPRQPRPRAWPTTTPRHAPSPHPWANPWGESHGSSSSRPSPTTKMPGGAPSSTPSHHMQGGGAMNHSAPIRCLPLRTGGIEAHRPVILFRQGWIGEGIENQGDQHHSRASNSCIHQR